METLSLRLERHAENTQKVVAFLSRHPQVEKVNHPSLPDHPDNGLYQKYFPNGGGYRLVKAPAECRIGDILRLTEGDLAPVACLESCAKPCDRAQYCRTYPLWVEFYSLVNAFFDGKTLEDLLEETN